MTERVKVIVYVDGGVVQAVCAGPFVDVLIIDGDDWRDDPEYVNGITVGEADAWDAQCDIDWARAEANAKREA